MATLTVRNVPDEVKQALRVRAARRGTSMEAEIREILREAAEGPVETRPESAWDHFERIRARFEPEDLQGLELPDRSELPRDPPDLS